MGEIKIYFLLSTLLITAQLGFGADALQMNSAGPKCKTPNGNTYAFGETQVRGCNKYVCNGLKWVVTSKSMCCVYQRKKFTIGTVIDSVTSEDGCTSAFIKCVPNGDKAKIDMRIKNDCPKPASEDTLIMYMDELKDLLEMQSNETAVTEAPTTAAPGTTAAPACESGWTYVQGNCYSVQTDTLTWEAAQTACTDLGAALASVSSVAVQAKLFDLQSENDFWLGGNDLTSDTTFTWINGDDWVYDNWNTNQPNHLSGQDCVKMKKNTGRWDDVGCTGTFMYACQKAHVGTFSFSNPGNQQSSAVMFHQK